VTRGDIVVVAAGAGFGGKPRPALVVQSNDFPELDTAVLALFTTDLVDAPLFRPRFEPDDGNGLERTSDLMTDILVTVRLAKIGKIVGRLRDDDLARADRALIVFLGLAS